MEENDWSISSYMQTIQCTNKHCKLHTNQGHPEFCSMTCHRTISTPQANRVQVHALELLPLHIQRYGDMQTCYCCHILPVLFCFGISNFNCLEQIWNCIEQRYMVIRIAIQTNIWDTKISVLLPSFLPFFILNFFHCGNQLASDDFQTAIAASITAC